MKLTVAEAAKLLGVRERDVYAWIRDRELPYVRVQDRCFIHRAHLYEWARDHDQPIDAAVFGESDGIGLAESLDAGALHWLGVRASVREVAEALVNPLTLPPGIGRAAVVDTMTARKDLGFAVDADGIAYPRLHEPLLLSPRAELHVFAFTSAWMLSGSSVTRLFLAVAPTVRAHQHLVAALGAALHRPDCLKLVVEPQSVAALAAAAR
jgi:excisionase family DNA binding protein